MDSDVGRQMGGGKEREPAGDVLFVRAKELPAKRYERIEDGAPGDLVVVN